MKILPHQYYQQNDIFGSETTYFVQAVHDALL